MAIRDDNSIEIDMMNIEQLGDRAAIRNYILNQWIAEQPNVKYRYFVESLARNRIYLERPGRLNKGCDFVIYIENHIVYNNGNDKPPPHDFILDDLRTKKQNLSEADWDGLISAINVIHECGPFNQAFAHVENLPRMGEDYDLILKTLRWLFIEQDVTYWSGQGRSMLYNAIMDI